jgi:long-chain acyl-CoA synthetase
MINGVGRAPGLLDNSMTMRNNLLSFLDDAVMRGNATAFVHRRGLRFTRWSYAKLRAVAFQFARELDARGIRRGDRVLIWGENSAEWVAAFFGCLLRGVIVVPLDLESAPDFVARVQQQVTAKLLLVSGDRHLDAPTLRLEELIDSVAHHLSSPYAHAEIGDSEIAEIIFTSGTTAEPKGVCLAHGNLLANLAPIEREVQKYIKWERPFHPLRFLNLLPLSHVFGQFMGIFIPQMLGGEIYFQDSLNPSEIITAIKKHRISVVVTVPRFLESLRKKIERDYAARGAFERFRHQLVAADQFAFLKRWWAFREIHRRFGWKFWAFVAGGASLNAETETFWRRLGYVVVQGYGMTETAALISVNHPFKVGSGSIGKALPGQEMKLDESGEILVRGSNVSPGYWRSGVQPLTNDEGWLSTGDIGEMDGAGNLYFKSRKKDVIVTAAGMNIYAEDLEAALKTQPEIRDSAVIGIDTPQGPEPMALLILNDDSADASTAVKRANEKLAEHQKIRRWAVWPESDFPRTPTQKIRKPALKQWSVVSGQWSVGANQQAATGNRQLTTASSFILQQVARVSGEAPTNVEASANLATDLKLDSLGRVELLSALEDHYQVDIDEAAFTAAATVGEIEQMVRAGERGQSVEFPYPKWPRRFPATWIRLVMLYLVMLPLTWLMSRARVQGRERLNEANGPMLFVANHITMVDQSLVQYALPARFQRRFAIAMEGEKLRGWRHPSKSAGWFTRLRLRAQYGLTVGLLNVFPLPQKSGFRRSFAFAGEMMDRGYSVLIFPEGRRTPDGEMKSFMEGIGLLAKNLNVPVVPVRIDGLYELKQRGNHFARPGQVRVTIGEPISFSRDEDAASIARELQQRVASL